MKKIYNLAFWFSMFVLMLALGVVVLGFLYLVILLLVGWVYSMIAYIPVSEVYDQPLAWIISIGLFLLTLYGIHKSTVAEKKMNKEKQIESMTDELDIHEIHLN